MSKEKLLVIVVGRSGVGKSTFIEAMDLPEYHCILSWPMIEELKRRGTEITHDTLHALAKSWYAEDPDWQISYVLAQLEEKSFLILDGLRYLNEMERLRRQFPNSLVVKIISSPEMRFERLKARGKVGLTDFEEFQRLEKDESEDMDVEALLGMADIAVENTGSLKEFQERAKRLGLFLR